MTRSVGTRSGQLAYTDAGTGPVALFVHGVATNGSLWRETIAEVAGDRRCIAIDLPLHGGSPPRPDYSLPALAEAIEDFREAMGLAAVDLVANDTGGAVAQVFAARHPERLRTLTLTNCDVHTNLPPESFAPVVELAARGRLAPSGPALAADPDAARTTSFAAAYEHPERVADDTIRSFLEPVLGTLERGREFERLLTSLRAEDLVAVEPELRKLEVPTLIVWGTDDPTFGIEWAHWLQETIPGAGEVVEIRGGRLFFPQERAGELAGHLRAHWSR